MGKVWKLKPKVSEEFCTKFPEFGALGAQLLYNRNLFEKAEIEEFLNTKYEGLHSPFLFKDMQKAVDRIWKAIDEGQKICIYGDYDADAVTANAVLQQTFRYLGTEVESYIPDRFTEGYGVNLDALLKIKDQGSKIIITVDCGTNSVDAAEFCKENGMDLIITDHHEIIGGLPDAYALINPKNPNDNYPYKEITGVGVAFKLACGILNSDKRIETREKDGTKGWEKWLLDLVAIGTVADCHSLMGENRILVKYGLKVLQKTKWTGLKALMRTAGLLEETLGGVSRQLDTYSLGFVIAPRLNAAGRLKHADIALHLLMEKDPIKATEKALELELINKERQVHTERILSEAREQAVFYDDRKVLVLLGEDWPKGIVGLVAGKLADEFSKPVIVMEKGETESTGSARTVGEFNVVEALKYASEHLVRFGGHKQAAGLTLKTASYEIFYQMVLEYADKELTEQDLQHTLYLEAELSESDFQLSTFNLITQFEPFGVGNPKPKFLVQGLELLQIRPVGAKKQHMQFFFQKGNKKIAGIGFNMPYIEKTFKVGDTVDVAAELIEDTWNGRQGVKLRVVDVRAS
jgi:single-stranded-DNA-specific exonuclease